MPRSPLFAALSRVRRLVHAADARRLPIDAALEAEARVSRRRFLGGAAALGVLGAAAPLRAAAGGNGNGNGNGSGAGGSVGIVGAGLAGLNAAYTLEQAGLAVSLYEAGERVGGRQFSGVLGGQTMEKGGELIDNLHKEMLGWVGRLGLDVEDLGKEPGEVRYFFGGQHHAESVVVDEYRAFVEAMRPDLQSSSGAPTAFGASAGDLVLDSISIRDYLDSRGAGPVIKAAIIEAYEAEYGLAAEEQSALNFLLFIHADKRSKFTPFGVFSDERYHVLGGNDQIAGGIHDHLSAPAQAQLGHRLVRVVDDGIKVHLTFAVGSQTVTRSHDRVILAIPFTVLRNVDMQQVAMPSEKRNAIDTLGYGTNAKTMIGFNGPAWRSGGSNGTAYSDLANLQNCWETSPTSASAGHAILTDYASAARGLALNTQSLNGQVGAFLADLDVVIPGTAAAAIKDSRKRYQAHLEPWPTKPTSMGSYTCYTLGQFTQVAGWESAPTGRVHYAGEHANSFYVWQGFMEGALLSGIDAASEILAEV